MLFFVVLGVGDLQSYSGAAVGRFKQKRTNIIECFDDLTFRMLIEKAGT